jgi:glycosyltransferase involved in cell wall biosynthesis
MTQIKPEVSIIISNKNHGKYLAKCIKSIENQSFSNYEIIITDDASADFSREILKNIGKIKNLKSILIIKVLA